MYSTFSRWSKHNVFEKIFKASVGHLKSDPIAGQLSEINLDGTHSLAKNGAEAVAYQRRKKGKTTNLLVKIKYNYNF